MSGTITLVKKLIGLRGEFTAAMLNCQAVKVS